MIELSLLKCYRMPKTINIHEAKTHLSRILEEVHAGEEIILAKAGKPYARLVPMDTPRKVPRALGGIIPPLSAEDVAESLRPLSDDELEGWT